MTDQRILERRWIRPLSLLFVILTVSFLFSCRTRLPARSGGLKGIPGEEKALQPEVRVLLKHNLAKLTLEKGKYVLRDGRGDIITRGERRVVLRKNGGETVDVDGRKVKGRLALESSSGVSIDGTIYRGTIYIHPTLRGISLVEKVNLERYVVSVLRREIPHSFSPQAMKAMSVAIRSYTLYRMERSGDAYYHLDSTNLSQVYSGEGDTDGAYDNAVRETEGIVLTYQGKPVLAVYHSTCGGRTERAANAWSTGQSYLGSVSCDFCRNSPNYRWRYVIDEWSFLQKFTRTGIRGGRVKRIDILSRTDTGRVKKISLVTEKGLWTLDGRAIRSSLGYSEVKSLAFSVRVSKGKLIFQGRGYGHGVGLCQYGANGLARSGASYHEILRFYYGKEVREKRIY